MTALLLKSCSNFLLNNLSSIAIAIDSKNVEIQIFGGSHRASFSNYILKPRSFNIIRIDRILNKILYKISTVALLRLKKGSKNISCNSAFIITDNPPGTGEGAERSGPRDDDQLLNPLNTRPNIRNKGKLRESVPSDAEVKSYFSETFVCFACYYLSEKFLRILGDLSFIWDQSTA